MNKDNMIERSIQGNNSSARSRKKQIKEQEQIKRLKKFALACVIVGGLGTLGTEEIVNKVQDNYTVSKEVNNFEKDNINKFTHITDNKEGYWYDYQGIENKMSEEIKNGADESTQIFLLKKSLGENQANEVLQYHNGGTSINEFLNERDLSEKEWNKIETKKVIANNEINKLVEKTNPDNQIINKGASK